MGRKFCFRPIFVVLPCGAGRICAEVTIFPGEMRDFFREGGGSAFPAWRMPDEVQQAFPLRTFAASANMPGACLQAKEARSDSAEQSEAERAAKAERANTKSPLSQIACGGRDLPAPPEGEPRRCGAGTARRGRRPLQSGRPHAGRPFRRVIPSEVEGSSLGRGAGKKILRLRCAPLRMTGGVRDGTPGAAFPAGEDGLPRRFAPRNDTVTGSSYSFSSRSPSRSRIVRNWVSYSSR